MTATLDVRFRSGEAMKDRYKKFLPVFRQLLKEAATRELWADYSAGWPGAAALKTSGFVGIIAYIGLGSSSKLITAAHYREAVAAGLKVRLVCEYNTHDAEKGRTGGRANAQIALADARTKNIPDSVPIAAAADEHLTASQVKVGVDYVRGFVDVLGASRTGAYGFAEFVDAVHAAAICGWWWKCGSAPTLAEATWITFWQVNTTGQSVRTVNKIPCDVDELFNNDEEDIVEQADIDNIVKGILTAKVANGATMSDAVADMCTGQSGKWGAGPGATWLVNALGAIQGAVTNEQAALLTAIQSIPAPGTSTPLTEEQVQEQANTIATSLAAALPEDVVKLIGERLAS